MKTKSTTPFLIAALLSMIALIIIGAGLAAPQGRTGKPGTPSSAAPAQPEADDQSSSVKPKQPVENPELRKALSQVVIPRIDIPSTLLDQALLQIETAANENLPEDWPHGKLRIVLRLHENLQINPQVSLSRTDIDVTALLNQLLPQGFEWFATEEKIVVMLDPENVTHQLRSRRKAGVADSAFGATAEVDSLSAPMAQAPAVAGESPSVHYNIAMPIMPPPDQPDYRGPMNPDWNTERYDRIERNAFRSPGVHPLSTFSIDVDTASYSNARRFLERGQIPPWDAVRTEEFVNYFPYDYAPPAEDAEAPLAVHIAGAAAPWTPEHRLVKIGVKGKELQWDERPPMNLVFLLDVSGSMQSANKLPLVKDSMRYLVEQLDERDRVALAVYAGAGGLVLDSTEAGEPKKIMEAIDNLEAGGSTNAGEGIELAYKVARDNLIKEGNNRVILCTDGDFNVGMTDQGELTRFIADAAKDGIQLTILGYGMGNYKDDMLETLSNNGDGNYGYIDTKREARKVFVEQLTGSLITIAKDVKIQVEFNPAQVQAYRLIGYENRLLKPEDFNDDTKDAGEVGAGHTVTALYEIVPPGVEIDLPGVDPLKYSKPRETGAEGEASEELLTVKLRYKLPDEDESTLMTFPFTDSGQGFAEADADFRFAAAAAGFAMLLSNDPFQGDLTYEQLIGITQKSLSERSDEYRREFLSLLDKAKSATEEERKAREDKVSAR